MGATPRPSVIARSEATWQSLDPETQMYGASKK